MKKILQINTVVNSGSTGRIAEEIGQLAIANGWESYIAYGRNESTSNSILIKVGKDSNLIMHGLKTRFLDRHGFGSRQATLFLVEQIKLIKPDIIHLHNIHGYYLNIEVLFNYLSVADIPIVWTMHDCWPITGHCTYFDSIGCFKWETGCFDCQQKKEYPQSLFIDNSKRNYSDKRTLFCSIEDLTIILVSKWLQERVKKSYLNKYTQKLIYNGVNTHVFYPRNNRSIIKKKLGVGNRFMLLGVASIWEKRKNLNDYVKLGELIDEKTIIVLVGLSEKQIKKLPNNIIGLSRTENISHLAEIYSAADIVLNLSAEETFGMTTVEGFACGTPGIVYNCTASPELITSNTGIIVEKGDMHGLVNAISEIETKGKAYYSVTCRDHAMKYFNKENKYKEYIQLYESLL